MFIGVLLVLTAACGAPGESSNVNDVVERSTMVTDSLPGQTDIGGGEDARSTSTLVDAQGANPAGAENGESDSIDPSTGGVGPGSTTTGAAVLALQGFSDFLGQRVGLIASRASVVDGQSSIDLFAEADGVELVAVFAPEHGVRANAGAGELIDDGIDDVTGLPIFSLFGSTRRPTVDMLDGLDVLVFDLQDVGTRFYTYTATMGLAMQTAAEAGVPFVVLDRPNPLGGLLVDGDLRDDGQTSFVSQYPIPAVHGMTAGELALAIKGEGWLDGLGDLDLRVVQLEGWDRSLRWDDTGLPWVAPSPGLPTTTATSTYPAVVLFEATTLSFGRGTDLPFGQVGAPWLDGDGLAADLNARSLPGVRFEPVRFTPVASPLAQEPQFEGQELSGVRIEILDPASARPSAIGVHLLSAVLSQAASSGQDIEVIDRAEFLDLLTGTTAVRQELLAGRSAESIVESWSAELAAFEAIRAKYLIY